MKTVKGTLEMKERCTKHFFEGKTAAQLPDDLKRMPIATIQKCQATAFEKVIRRK